jgi:hypothetical protein
MKKPVVAGLSLRPETIRTLTENNLKGVGGAYVSQCPSAICKEEGTTSTYSERCVSCRCTEDCYWY